MPQWLESTSTARACGSTHARQSTMPSLREYTAVGAQAARQRRRELARGTPRSRRRPCSCSRTRQARRGRRAPPSSARCAAPAPRPPASRRPASRASTSPATERRVAHGQRARQRAAAALADQRRRARRRRSASSCRRSSSRSTSTPAQPTLARMPLMRTRWPRRRSQPRSTVSERVAGHEAGDQQRRRRVVATLDGAKLAAGQQLRELGCRSAARPTAAPRALGTTAASMTPRLSPHDYIEYAAMRAFGKARRRSPAGAGASAARSRGASRRRARARRRRRPRARAGRGRRRARSAAWRCSSTPRASRT